MSTPQRLPAVGSDDGTWGNILVQYLQLQHVNTGVDYAGNGGHQNVTITAGTALAAPLTFNSGTSLTTPAAGSVEFNTDTLYFTITTGTARETIAMFNDASGAQGDIYYRGSGSSGSAGPLNRLGVGSTGQVLGVSSGVPSWQTLTNPTATTTSTYTLSTNLTVVLANATSGNVTVTIPLAASCSGYSFTVKRIDNSANTCQVSCSGSDTIDGQASIGFNAQYLSMTMISNGSAWYII